MKTKSLAKTTSLNPICVFLKPCVEKQDLNYFEQFTGTPEQILNRSAEIIRGLKAIFRDADFSVKIEDINLTQTIYLDSGILFDEDFNEIGNLEDYAFIIK